MWGSDLTFLARFRMGHTEDIENLSRDKLPAEVPATFPVARFVSATTGFAYRPLDVDWLDVVFKYSYLVDMRPTQVADQSTTDRSHVVSLAPIIDLPFHIRLSGKTAWKRTANANQSIQAQELSADTDALLGLVRLGLRFFGSWDVSGEARALRLSSAGAQQTRTGTLAELDYNVNHRVRLGAGYNFSHFADDELADLSRDAAGFFLRVVGRY